MSQTDIGKFIAESRRRRGLTQQDLAQLLGVTNKAVSKWETGKGLPDIGILPALVAALGVSADELLAGRAAPADETRIGENKPALFTAAYEVAPARLRRQCGLARRAVDRLPRAVFAVCVFLLIALVAALLVLRMALGGIDFLWLGLIILALGLLWSLLGHRLAARRQWEEFTRQNGEERGLTLRFFDDGFEAASHTSRTTYGYGDLAAGARQGDSILLRCRGTDYLVGPEDLTQGSFENWLLFLAAKAPGAKKIEVRAGRRAQLLIALLVASAGGCLLLMQLMYLWVGRVYRFEYLYDVILYGVNATVILLLLAAAVLVWHRRLRVVVGLGLAAALLFCGNLYAAALPGNALQKTLASESPRGLSCVVKVDPLTGRANLCRPSFLWFVRPKDTLAHPVAEGQLRMEWLAGDVCAVTYRSPHSDTPQVYVATYGDRSSGGAMSYYGVASALAGGYWVAPQSMREWTFESDDDGFLLSNFERTEHFPWEDCMQYGSTALVLYKDGQARWVVALGDDVVEDGGVLQAGGTIYISAVSMESAAPVPFTNGLDYGHFGAMK